MQVTLVPSATSAGPRRRHYLTSYLINDDVAIDAGCLGFHGTADDQARVRHVFLTHTHLDHVASLPMFLDNAYNDSGDPVTVYGTQETLDCVQRDLFNDRLWPDLVRLSCSAPPFLRLHALTPGETIRVGGVSLTPVPMDHIVPTVGYLLADDSATVAIASDTAPTQALWERARAAANLKAVFLEATFPDEMTWLAEVAKHLTPRLFAAEAAKVPSTARLFAVHIHPRYQDQVIRELKELRLPNLEIGRYGKPYVF